MSLQWQTSLSPGGKPSIEQIDIVALAEPGQQPPGARGKGAGAVVVEHDAAVVVDADFAQSAYQPLRLRQRMAPGHAGLHRAGEIALQIQEARAWQMAFEIAALAMAGVFKGKAAIDQQALRQAVGQLLGGDQACKRHRELLGKSGNTSRPPVRQKRLMPVTGDILPASFGRTAVVRRNKEAEWPSKPNGCWMMSI